MMVGILGQVVEYVVQLVYVDILVGVGDVGDFCVVMIGQLFEIEFFWMDVGQVLYVFVQCIQVYYLGLYFVDFYGYYGQVFFQEFFVVVIFFLVYGDGQFVQYGCGIWVVGFVEQEIGD